MNARPVTVLGLDLGTSSAKAVVLDTEGRVLAQASAGYAVTSAAAGYAESDPGDWWRAVTACAREAVRTADARPAAIGLSGQMHGLVLPAPDGAAVRPAILWPDSRAVGALRAYRLLGSAALDRLANPLSPGMTGPLLLWIAEHEPRSYAAARWALQPKDWLRARLTAEFHAEPSDASGTLLYDVPGDRWDLAAVSALGLDARLLAPLLPSSGAPAGRLTPARAAELGLPAVGGDARFTTTPERVRHRGEQEQRARHRQPVPHIRVRGQRRRRVVRRRQPQDQREPHQQQQARQRRRHPNVVDPRHRGQLRRAVPERGQQRPVGE